MKKSSLSLIVIIASLALVACPKKEKEKEEKIDRLEGTIEERLSQMECLSNVRSVSHGDAFEKVFKMNFKQYIDHEHPELGTFNQKIEVGYNGLDLPTDYVTSGYMIESNNSTWASNENEIAFLLGCNYIFVEHRYFGNSLPVPIGYDDNETWKYLTTKQAADDAHNIVTQFKRVFEGTWVSTGISKGGMTTELYAYYHPGDMDLYMPYVAPMCASFSDKRMFEFVYEEAGNLQYGTETAATMRQNILNFQIKLLEYRDVLAPKFYNAGVNSRVSFSSYANADRLFDAAVLEFSVGFWQYYQDYSTITRVLAMSETTTAQKQRKQEACYSALTSVSGPSDISINNEFTPYYIQAYQELGNYGYDFSYLRNALPSGVELKVTEEEESDLMRKLVLNDAQLQLPQKELMAPKINNMLKTTKDQFIILYGSSDPWYSVRPDDVTSRSNINIYVNDNYPHTTNIANYDTNVNQEIMAKVKSILKVA